MLGVVILQQIMLDRESTRPEPRTSRHCGWLAIAVASAIILLATSFPVDAPRPGGLSLCLLCGERGLADAILNVLLFVPFGAALALAHVRLTRALVVAAAFTASIELAQLLVIAGRDPSVGDLVFNTLGAACGFGLTVAAPFLWRPSRRLALLLSWSWSGLAAVVVLGSGILLEPDFPRATYFGAWTPATRHLEAYEGRVLQVGLGASSIPSAPIPDSPAARELLLAGAPFVVRARAGAAPPGLAPLVIVNDAGRREVVLLGVDREDLVFRYRTRARSLLLDQPDLRARGLILDAAPGDSMLLAAWRQGTAHCLAHDQHRRCGIGFTVARGWSLLLYPEGAPGWAAWLFDVVWIAAFFAPLGYWAAVAPRGWLALAPALVAYVAAPRLTELVRPAPSELAAVATWLLAGTALAWLVTTRHPGRRQHRPPVEVAR